MSINYYEDFIERDILRQKNAALEKELERIRLKELAMKNLKFPDPTFDPFDEARPFESRSKIIREMERIEAEELRQKEQKAREEKRWAEHLEWEAKRESEAKMKTEKIANNTKLFGHTRPETLEIFKSMSEELRFKTLEMFGGEQFLAELARKGSMPWAQFEALKAADPNAIPVVPPPPPVPPAGTVTAAAASPAE